MVCNKHQTQVMRRSNSEVGHGFDLTGFGLDDINENIIHPLDCWEECHDGAKPKPINNTPPLYNNHRSPPKSILRRASWPPMISMKRRLPHTHESDFRPNACQKAVRFPSESQEVTAVHVRPTTHVLDIPVFHYSREDIRRFKQEFKQEAVELLQQHNEEEVYDLRESEYDDEFYRHQRPLGMGVMVGGCGQSVESDDDDGSYESVLHHCDNSYWRSKVGMQWGKKQHKRHNHGSLRRATSTNQESKLAGRTLPDQARSEDWPKNNDDATPSLPTSTGIFSSVFLALSLLSGPPPNGSSQENQHRITSCAVDTLYLF